MLAKDKATIAKRLAHFCGPNAIHATFWARWDGVEFLHAGLTPARTSPRLKFTADQLAAFPSPAISLDIMVIATFARAFGSGMDLGASCNE